MTQNSFVGWTGVDKGMRRHAVAHRLQEMTDLPGAGDNIVLDCTTTERLGLRGPGTIDWLSTEGLAVSETVNATITLPCRTTVVRLGQQEVLLTAVPGGHGKRLRELRSAWQKSALPVKGYDAYRDEGWAWFIISGPAAPALLRRISMADLRPDSLLAGQVAQTRALHLDVVIARLDRFGTMSYDIFFDIASAAFALDVLAETAASLGAGFRLATFPPAG